MIYVPGALNLDPGVISRPHEAGIETSFQAGATDGNALYAVGSSVSDAGNRDALVEKFDAYGNVLWSAGYDGGNGDDATLEAALESGATRINLGTAALENLGDAQAQRKAALDVLTIGLAKEVAAEGASG